MDVTQGSDVEYKPLGEVVKIKNGKDWKSLGEGNIPVYGSGGIMGHVDTPSYDKVSVLIPRKGTITNIFYVEEPFWNVDTIFYTEIDHTQMIPKFFYYVMKNTNLTALSTESTRPSLTQTVLNRIKIPIPSLEIQQKVVEILDKMTDYVTELTLRQKQYAYYRAQLLTFLSQSDSDESHSVKWLTLGEIGEVRMCKRILKSQTSATGDVPFFKIGTFGKKPNAFISHELFEEYKEKYSYPKVGDLLISASGTIGKIVKFDGKDAYFQDSNIVWIDNDETQVRNDYLKYYYQIANWGTSQGGTITRLYNDGLKKMKIAVPPLELQYKIVEILDNFDKLTSDLSEGLPREIELRQKQYEYWREQLLSFR
ncbi:hypothetical protein YA68_08580 [Lactococcus garvieae]|nr:hypothetical protein YA68_08580 [Lactococcus garvieae]